MRVSACFSHWEGTQKSRFSVYSTSVQVSYYWCHRESWQLLLLRSQRLQDELIRHAAESKTRPGLERRERDTGSQEARKQNRYDSFQHRKDSEIETKAWYAGSSHSSVTHESVFPHLTSTYLFWRQREEKTVSEPRLMPCLVHATDNLPSPSDCLLLISTLTFFLLKINMIQFL